MGEPQNARGYLPPHDAGDPHPKIGKRVNLNSWRAKDDPGPGNFTAGLYAVSIPQIYIWNNGVRVWRSGPWNGRILTGAAGMYSVYVDGFSLGMEEDGTYYFSRNFRQSFVSRNFLNYDGVLVEAGWDDRKRDWEVKWTGPGRDCDLYNKCGPSAICYDHNTPICASLKGYEPRNGVEWSKGIWDGGCWMSGLETECESLCLRNCSCLAYAYDPGIGCMFWSGDLIDLQKFPGNAGSDFYVRVAYSDADEEKSNKRIVSIVSVVASFVVALICLAFAWWTCKRKGVYRTSAYVKGGNGPSDMSEVVLPSDMDKVKIEELPLYSFEMIVTATVNFDTRNMLGMGGFGPVYKGSMANGDKIAVKRLSTASGQGYKEFMNEVLVISKLQHRNLVRLLGCCVERGEKMLIYEYMQHGSLDLYLFDKTHDILDWRKWFNIMEGIGRGLLYLHRDSRLRIIHRDLKPSNVLLDEDQNPKISDFGMARIFGGNQDQANTGKVVGTYGYMSPEYVMWGIFSEKSDVFSFGVIVLEMICGRRNTSFYNEELSLGLLGYAWKVWNEGNVEDFIDMEIYSPSLKGEIMRSMLTHCLPSPTGGAVPTQTPSANHVTHTTMEGR
ncbi:non-specific serine/threonine protein kinase [Salvia divinorum]|uniref:non-specific serine/threonine protein kinase n=1 Tax=Salvia divinorum TaxID=28513 RepID=A0ABD1IF41_SALDI